MNERKNSKIPVHITPGMFSDEYVVEIKLAKGGTASLFANRDNLYDVDIEKKSGWLIVEVSSVTADGQIVVLPNESLESGTKWLEVIPSEIKAYDLEQCSNSRSD